MSQLDQYQNPLITRYASDAMSGIWGDRHRFSTWRRLWIALAEAEQELGISISDEQIQELKQNQNQIDFERAAELEKEKRHDVMAHVHTYGEQCPGAKGIIHLGATSCFVTDNTDLILLREALELVKLRLVDVIMALAEFAKTHRNLACLGFTHLQPAQPTTVGKRACLWLYDLVMDLEELEHRCDGLKARSTKGTTGTQASFLELFNGDHGKVVALEQAVAKKMGFKRTYAVTGQTYSRKVDAQLVDSLSGVAQTAHKMGTDLRILAHRKEWEEPFEAKQIGSSAMAYKRNPMRSERICALARFVMSLQSSPAATFATQWMERTLDDSANRRLVLPQAFLAIDAILVILKNVVSGIVVYPRVIEKNLREELPFMATENILMAAVSAGGDRQELHERIREHSVAAGKVVKQDALPNDLMERISNDPAFAGADLSTAQDPLKFVGRAPEQVDTFLSEEIEPIRKRYANQQQADEVELKV